LLKKQEFTSLHYGARGPFLITTYTRTATTKKAIDMTLEVIQSLHQKGVTQEALDSAKNYLFIRLPRKILKRCGSFLRCQSSIGNRKSAIPAILGQATISRSQPGPAVRRLINQYLGNVAGCIRPF
jgi:hypothetical protein